MKQIILPLHTGKPELTEVPAPGVAPGEVLIRNTASVISAGTERMLIDFGQAGWLGKLRQQPEKVRQVLEKLKTDGLMPTINAVRNKLDTPIPLGYSSAGIVFAVGEGVHDIRVGDRVASNGPHAEIVCVPRNLTAKIPDGVSSEAAAFTVLGAIALQSIRLVQPTFGETVVVIGLGLIGQLTAQLLLANGCRVIGTDLHTERLRLAEAKGVQTLTEASGDAARAMTNRYGADAVIVTASAANDTILSLAADMCRKRGRIVLTGVVDMQLSRDHFFRKELSFQVSSSYGPGRYERAYEQRGLDYPIGYVRWTEARNFEAVLSAMDRGKLDIQSLISRRIPFAEAASAYAGLDMPEHIATLFTYGDFIERKAAAPSKANNSTNGKGIAIVGAGAFTSGTLLPALKAAGVQIQSIVSKSGLSAATLAGKLNIPQAGTDIQTVLQDNTIGSIIIATPHDTHASLASAALTAGRHVFAEKPLAISIDELEQVRQAYAASGKSLTVGFNRRFAPLAILGRQLLEGTGGPMNIIITVNAGMLPSGHWLADQTKGGGRLIGEACHFVDLSAFFAGGRITSVCANAIAFGEEQPPENASVLLRFSNGSNAVVNYFSNGSKAYDKERIELYRAGCTIVIENWRTLRSFGFRKDITKRIAQDKGHKALIAAWIKSLECEIPVFNAEELLNTSAATIAIEESLRTNGWVSV